MRAAGLGAVAAGVLALAAGAGRPILLVALLAAQVALVVGWSRWARLPARPATWAIVAVVAVTGDVLCLPRRADGLGRLAALLGLAFLAMLLDHLLRRERSRLTDSLATTMSAAVLVTMLAVPLALPPSAGGRAALSAGFAAATVTLAALVPVSLLPAALLPDFDSPWSLPAGCVLAVLAGSAGGAVYGLALADLGVNAGTGIGAAAAVLAVGGWLITRSAHSVSVQALLPLALVAPAGYLAGRLLVG